jgi:cell division protein FtsQ
VNTKATIRKVIFIAVWVAIGGGMITLLAAAMKKQKSERCKDYSITIKGAKEHLFVDEKDVFRLLSEGSGGKIKDQPMSSFKLRKLEQLLEDNTWIRDAELYFDNKMVLHVNVTERQPVARVFTAAGRSFYIDEEERRMPLSDKVSARVPVYTGFPDKKVLTKKDSLLLHHIRTSAQFIGNDPFWFSQVSQIDITPQREFEMIPVVGNHVVKMGDGEDMEKKFHRLFVFYKNVLSKTGFDKYKTINVQYAGQVIGVKDNNTKVDSVQLRRNVEKLLQQARELQFEENTAEPAAVTNAATNNEASDPNPLKLSEAVATKEATTKEATTKEATPKKTEPKQPKAVMPRKN